MRKKVGLMADHFEFDIIAHNGNEIVIVEVKTTLKVKDVDHFYAQLQNMDRKSIVPTRFMGQLHI